MEERWGNFKINMSFKTASSCIEDVKITEVYWQTLILDLEPQTMGYWIDWHQLSSSGTASCLIAACMSSVMPAAAFNHGWSTHHRMMPLRNDTTTKTGLSRGKWHHQPPPPSLPPAPSRLWPSGGYWRTFIPMSSMVTQAAAAARPALACMHPAAVTWNWPITGRALFPQLRLTYLKRNVGLYSKLHEKKLHPEWKRELCWDKVVLMELSWLLKQLKSLRHSESLVKQFICPFFTCDTQDETILGPSQSQFRTKDLTKDFPKYLSHVIQLQIKCKSLHTVKKRK